MLVTVTLVMDVDAYVAMATVVGMVTRIVTNRYTLSLG